jgi:hypothetical protein
MCGSARKRARALGVGYDIDAKYVESICPADCPVFFEPLKYGGGPKSKWSASLDRIMPEEGYVHGNVQVISLLANTMKNEATYSELCKFARWVRCGPAGLRTYEKRVGVARTKMGDKE